MKILCKLCSQELSEENKARLLSGRVHEECLENSIFVDVLYDVAHGQSFLTQQKLLDLLTQEFNRDVLQKHYENNK